MTYDYTQEQIDIQRGKVEALKLQLEELEIVYDRENVFLYEMLHFGPLQ